MAFTIKTLGSEENISTPVPAYGSVKDANNNQDIKYSELKPVKDGIIYLNFL